ncbi:c-type cytochrome biogenesis protein CcmI [Fodinicurvata sediminis]|uniref:c-type cytochrome biogenesis protein CcmI n=1 Tax=Fodinicurvata sediminis TaxID=1121832 RepID=UPI00058DCE3A|nr:c-type cytochrome biogenesis protein CcmI [Fodinicurvata sediminis]
MSWLFWILAAALTALIAILLVRPLLKGDGRGNDSAGEEDLQVYRAQLREVDRDLERGVLAQSEAKAARLEIERRLLAADARQRPERIGLPKKVTRLMALALLALLPLGTLGTYLWLGQPGLPGQPLAQRGEEVQEQRNIAEMVQGLRARLENNPDDRQGWEMLGRSYGVLGRWQEAAEAYREALKLSDGPRPALQSALGEALVTVNQGEVSPGAERAFDAALSGNPQDARARFYKALALHQRGDLRSALDRWIALAEDTPQDAGWRPMLMQQIAATAQELGLNPEEVNGGESTAERPSVQDMDPEEQEAYIRSMVDGLAARLQDNPQDPEGWLRLGQARLVLEERDAAVEALENARQQIEQLPADSPERDELQRALDSLEQRL